MTADPDSSLRDAWHRFVAGQPPGPAVRPVILESWRRSIAAGVDPFRPSGARANDVADRLAVDARLVEVAVPHLEWINRALGDVSHAVSLVDGEGVVLAARGNDEALLARYGVRPDADWSERARGTSGAGTALAAAEPVLVWGAEHFVQDLHGAVGTGAPIRARDGSVVGAVEITTRVADGRPERLALAAYVAHVIGQETALREDVRATETLRVLGTLQHVTQAALEQLSPDAVAHAVLPAVRAVLRASSAAVLLVGVDGRTFEPAVTMGEDAVVRSLEDVARDAITGGAPVVRSETAVPSGALVGVPLRARDQILGALTVATRHPHVAEDDLRLLELLAERVALGVDRARATERDQQGRAGAEEARRAAERANRAKDQFLAVVSHELRVPLNAILGWARILRTASTTPETVLRAAEAIERSVRIQAELVDDLLDVSRIVTGKMALDLRRIDLAEVVDAAVDTMSRAAADKGVTVTVTADPTATAVRGDARRLRQVFTNLLENAVKFSLPDGAVTVRIVAESGFSVVHIDDAGIGIAADAVVHVFDPFYQEEPFVPHATGGLGLGLAIVRGVVELHGGSVHVTSAGRGQGATFTVRLPAKEA